MLKGLMGFNKIIKFFAPNFIKVIIKIKAEKLLYLLLTTLLTQLFY